MTEEIGSSNFTGIMDTYSMLRRFFHASGYAFEIFSLRSSSEIISRNSTKSRSRQGKRKGSGKGESPEEEVAHLAKEETEKKKKNLLN